MESIRKYWLIFFLGAALLSSIAAMLEPSWEPSIRIWTIGGFVVAFLYGIYERLERIEVKLKDIIKKLDDR
jgi:hypothetical protein